MYIIKKISPSSSGERLLLLIAAPDGETKTLSVRCDVYRRLGLAKGEISDETYDEIVSESVRGDALAKGLNILGYGANSPLQLKNKLRRAGFSEETSEETAAELCRLGYMDEKGDACRIAEELAHRGYGQKRILASLRAKGYCEEALCSVIESFEEINFVENCIRVARVKFKKLKNDRAEVQKALAKLLNLGYNVGDAKKALETILSERN